MINHLTKDAIIHIGVAVVVSVGICWGVLAEVTDNWHAFLDEKESSIQTEINANSSRISTLNDRLNAIEQGLLTKQVQ